MTNQTIIIMKKLAICALALLFSLGMSAQPGGFGGPGGMGGGFGGPGMGMGPGMGPGMGMGGFDIYGDVRKEYAANKTEELTSILELNEKQVKQVKKIYGHTDEYLMSEMMEKMSKNRNANGGPQGGFPGMGGGFPGGMNGGMPGGMPDFENMEREVPKVIPISKREREYRENKMSKILTPEQYEKWLEIEAQDLKIIAEQEEEMRKRFENPQAAPAE